MLLSMVQAGLNAKKLVSHRSDLSNLMKAYDTFGNASKGNARSRCYSRTRDRAVTVSNIRANGLLNAGAARIAKRKRRSLKENP